MQTETMLILFQFSYAGSFKKGLARPEIKLLRIIGYERGKKIAGWPGFISTMVVNNRIELLTMRIMRITMKSN